MDKTEQQQNKLHQYKKLNELSDGELFESMEKLNAINTEIDELKKQKNTLEIKIQEMINGKKLMPDN